MHTPIEITRKQLRSFGYVMAGGLVLFFGMLIPWIWGSGFPRWPWVAAVVFAALGSLVPYALLPLYKLWMAVGAVLGWINSRIILGVVFFVIIFPIGLIIRLFSYDPMAKHFEPQAKSYRIKSETAPDERLEKPF